MSENKGQSAADNVMEYSQIEEQISILPVADAAVTRRALWQMFRKYPAWVYLSMCFLSCFITGILQLIPGYLCGVLINHLRIGQGAQLLSMVILVWLGLNVARFIANFSSIYIGYIASSSLLATIRELFIRRILTLHTSLVEQSGTGDLMMRSGADNEEIGDTVTVIFTQLIEAAITILAVIVMLIFIAPPMLLCLLFGAVCYVPTIRWCLRRSPQIYRRENQTRAMLAQSLAITMQGAKTIESYSLAEARRQETHAMLENYSVAVRKRIKLSIRLITGVEFSLYLPLFGVILCGSWFYHLDLVSLGAVFSAGVYMIELVHPVETILYWIDQLQSAYAAFSRIEGVSGLVVQEDFHRIHGEKLPTISQNSTPQVGEVHIKNLSFHYPHSGHAVIKDISLHIPSGTRVVIVGRSGAGKSTLARLVAGLDTPSQGSVTISDTEITHLPISLLRKYAVLVTQEHYIFQGTIADNLRIAKENATDAQLLAALHLIEADWIDEIGLYAQVGPGFRELSAAQAQQIALARVLLADPAVVILDEATSLLDPHNARISETVLSRVMHNRTIIAIAHRLYSAEVADQILVLEQGKVVESGSHTELLLCGGAYAGLWNAWIEH